VGPGDAARPTAPSDNAQPAAGGGAFPANGGRASVACAHEAAEAIPA
jgi:hypothetical protein